MTTAAAQSPPAAARIKVTSDTDPRQRSERSSALKRLGLSCHAAPKSVFPAVFFFSFFFKETNDTTDRH